MNGLRTRNHFHTAFRARTERERAELAERMDGIIARMCGVGLLAMLIVTLIEQVAP